MKRGPHPWKTYLGAACRGVYTSGRDISTVTLLRHSRGTLKLASDEVAGTLLRKAGHAVKCVTQCQTIYVN